MNATAAAAAAAAPATAAAVAAVIAVHREMSHNFYRNVIIILWITRVSCKARNQAPGHSFNERVPVYNTMIHNSLSFCVHTAVSVLTR